MRKLILLAVILAQAVYAQQGDVRNAIERALPMLQKSAATFVEKRACFSCHHNALPIMTLHQAWDRGFAIDEKVLANLEEKTFRPVRSERAFDDAVQATALNDPTPNDSLLLMAAQAGGIDRDIPLQVYARRIASWQRDGHWITSDFRPPHSSSLFTATATAIRAIKDYMPVELREERDRRLQEAAVWLVKKKPASTEDASFRVMGLVWADAPYKDRRAAEKDLEALQHSDGGWGQLPGYPSDVYSTGEVLYALSLTSSGPVRSSGSARFAAEFSMSPGGLVIPDAYSKGLAFLVSSQASDGTWHVVSRMTSPAEVSPPYFETGFPYEHDQFISYAATNWALMALLAATDKSFKPMSGSEGKPPANKIAEPRPPSPEYARTVLFDTSLELKKLLDAGLDVNQQTPNGTTLLMMAASDPAKVKLLLSRGAKVKARSKTNVDALTVAASYYGNAASISALLSAGAEAQAPDGVKSAHSPLGLATMSGDLAEVKLLLAKGADPAAGYPLGEAITFNHPQIAQALIKAGSSADAVESTGINLLHWATITNRPALIPVLVKAGVPLNEVDEHGYTPLMYAAEVDFGDTRALTALLAAGADTRIKDPDGKTALQHAQMQKHVAIERVLAAKP